MDAPKSKRFRELRRRNGAVTGRAVKESIQGRRKGVLKRVFSQDGHAYKVTTISRHLDLDVPAVQPVPIPAKK